MSTVGREVLKEGRKGRRAKEEGESPAVGKYMIFFSEIFIP